MFGTLLAGCQTSTTRVPEEEKQQAKSVSRYEQYKIDTKERIQEYEKNISDLKVRMLREDSKRRAQLDVKIKILERDYKDIVQNLDNYRDENDAKWTSYKNKMQRNMSDLGKSISAFFTEE
jgi:hypothetical protein